MQNPVIDELIKERTDNTKCHLLNVEIRLVLVIIKSQVHISNAISTETGINVDTGLNPVQLPEID